MTFGQTNVKFKVNHKLGTSSFALNQGAQNNIGNDFRVTRLQYYIGEISITHDGGTVTPINDTWLLVDATTQTEVSLGNLPVTNVEKVTFHIGVGASHNHADPATYASSHPLAPKMPSMHWGWTSGYRFVAFEGHGSSSYNQLVQLHGLGDENYFKTEVTMAVGASGGEVMVALDADYTRALEDITVNAGNVVHGTNGDAKKILVNFQNHVFKAANESMSIGEFEKLESATIFPNPSTANGTIQLAVASKYRFDYEIGVTDVLGRAVSFQTVDKDENMVRLKINTPGAYLVSLYRNNKAVRTEKVIIR